MLLIVMINSCYTVERKYYYGDELINKIKEIKKNKKVTYLSYQLPKFSNDNMEKYMAEEIQYKFDANKFENGEAIFALIGRSTKNYGKLEKIIDNQRIPIDSASCDYGEFIFLKLNPVKRGNYKIIGSGCRYGKEFDIIIN